MKKLLIATTLPLLFFVCNAVPTDEVPDDVARPANHGMFHLPRDVWRNDNVQNILRDYRNDTAAFRLQIQSLKAELEAAAVADRQAIKTQIRAVMKERHRNQVIFRKYLRRLVRDYRTDRIIDVVTDRP